MAAFRFELDALLKKVRRSEDDAQRELAKSLRQRMILQSQIQADQRSISQAKLRLADALVGTVDLDRVRQFAQFSGTLTQRAQSIVVRIFGLERQIIQHRELLSKASRKRKAIELLYEKRYEAWKRVQSRRQSAELDEMAIEAHRRRRSGAVA